MPHKMAEDSYGQVKWAQQARPELNSPGNVSWGWQNIRRSTMNEVDELITAMLAIAFAAVMLVAGGLYIDRPVQPPTVPAAQMASGP